MQCSTSLARPARDEGIVRGNELIAEYVRGHVDPVTTVHHGHMPEIEITSPTTATGIWSMEDMLRWPEGSPIAAMHGYGHYHETYEKIDGQWRIASCTAHPPPRRRRHCVAPDTQPASAAGSYTTGCKGGKWSW